MSAAAQDNSITTPSLGVAFDPDLQALRAIRGIPGAALLDETIDPGFRILSAAIAPQNKYALVTAEDFSVRLLRFGNANIAVRELETAMPAPDLVIYSPRGGAALLYRSSGRLQLISGLPDRPAVKDWILPSAATAATALAVTDDGTLLAVSTGDPESGLWLLGEDGSSSQLAIPGATAIAFRADSHELMAATAAGDLHLAGGPNAEVRVLRQAATANPVALRFSSEAMRAYAVDGAGVVSVVDLDSGEASRISCGCRADRLEPLNTPNLFRLTAVSDMPLMLFDASHGAPATWFVPRGGRP